jgi:Cof subfamily protein (haloacid dehalogenase superfamily)
MPDIRAMVFDLDGTLLNRRSCLSTANERALRACLARGILLYVATARPPRFMNRLGDPPGQIAFLAGRGVFYNGALAVDQPLNYERHWTIAAEATSAAVSDLANVAPDLNVAIQWVDHGHAFRLPVDDRTLADWAVTREELRPFDQASRQPCSKIIAWHENLHLGNAHAELQQRYGHRLNIFLTDSDRALQLMDRCATKENALLDLLSLQGIPSSDVAVFGDASPDVGMFRTFGHSVAMGNAPAVIKAAATCVTADCDEDGVAMAIHECFGIT